MWLGLGPLSPLFWLGKALPWDPRTAPLPTNTLTLLPVYVPEKCPGHAGRDTHHLAHHLLAKEHGGPSPGQAERSLDLSENHLGREGGHTTPRCLLLFLSSVLCLFLGLWRLPACGQLRLGLGEHWLTPSLKDSYSQQSCTGPAITPMPTGA